MRARQVLMLDFDKKDYPELKTAQDLTALIKAKVPQLFVHMIVDTGHGYHAYIAISRCVNIERVTAANRALAEITGADLKATSPTQIARIPTSFNLKDDDHKPVTVVSNAWERSPTTFKRYNLQRLEGIIEQIQRNDKNLENATPLPASKVRKSCGYYCIEAMLAEGADKGARNFCLGRIVSYLKTIKGFTKINALAAVREWNRRCRPSKSEAELVSEFERYWNGEYKLLGCSIRDESKQAILNLYCDKTLCTSIFEESPDSNVEGAEMFFDNNVLKNRIMRNLTGYHFLIISVLDFVNKPIKRKELVTHLTSRREKKCCMGVNTLGSVLNELVKRKYIIYDDVAKTYELNRKTYKPTYTRYSYSATILLINKCITPTEYMVYLCLVRNLQKGDNVTYETIASDLDKDESNIGKYIKRLHQVGLLNIDASYTNRGVLHNTYRLFY